MSCHVIYMKDGRKMMRPVLTREEYMSLRDSEENRRADKRHMVQMNYSCLPNDDGSLKGTTRMSTTIGADIDVPIDTAFVLSKKDELGLLMFENSATKPGCGHVVCRRIPELSQEDNLKRISEILGVEYDKGAKDITRVFFTPADKLVYLDEELFKAAQASSQALPAPSLSFGHLSPGGESGVSLDADGAPSLQALQAPSLSFGHLSPGGESGVSLDADGELPQTDGISSEGKSLDDKSADGKSANGTTADGVTASASSCSLLAFDLCVQQAGLNPKAMDVWGEHNWHANLMAVLSVGLPKLMSKEQLLAVVREKLPNYSQTEDCQKLIAYFYENYQADKGFMSSALRSINAKAQGASLSSSHEVTANAEAEAGEDAELDAIMSDWTPPTLPKKLPRLVELEVRNYDSMYRESLVQCSVVGHSGLASHFRARYINNKTVTPATMVSVIGGSGSGKDNCTQLFNDQMRYTIEETERQEWEKVRANTELREKMRNANECPPKYHPKIRIFESASKTSLLELQSNLGDNGMLVGLFSEADGYVGASTAGWSNLSVMLRKGYSGEKHRQFYMSDTTCNTSTSLNISLLIEGTPKAILERMFNDKNCENGTMQRFAPVLMPKKKRTFRPPMQNFLTDDEVKERDALLMELYQKDLALGDDTLMIETPKTNNAIGQWYDSLEERFNDGELTEAEADLSHRCGEFMLKAALPLIVLYGETKEVIDYAVWVGEMAFYNMCHIYGHRVQEDIKESNDLLSNKFDARKTAEPLLDKMPVVFNLKQFKEQREKDGQSTEVRMLLSRYCKNGKLERIGKGVYRKRSLPRPSQEEGSTPLTPSKGE